MFNQLVSPQTIVSSLLCLSDLAPSGMKVILAANVAIF